MLFTYQFPILNHCPTMSYLYYNLIFNHNENSEEDTEKTSK